jgi:hypothetical protein
MINPLLLLEHKLLGDMLAGFQGARGGHGHLFPIVGNHPPVLLRQLIVSPVE